MSTAATPLAKPPVARWTRLVGDFTKPAENSIGLRVATLLAVVIATVAVLVNGVGGTGLWIVALGVIPIGAAVSFLRREERSPLVPVLLTLTTLAITIRFIMVNGSPASPAELRLPLAELLITLEGVRAFSLRSRRDLRFALASSVALISLGGALSLSITFGSFLALWGSCAAAAMALAHRSELIELAGGVRPSSRRRLASGPVRVVTTAAIAVGVVATTAFLVVPAAKSNRLLAFTSRIPDQVRVPNPGGLSNPSLGNDNPSRGGDGSSGSPPSSFGYFGFSKELDTSVRGRPDDTLVLRVRSSAPDFWRGQTFDVWDGRRWTISDERTAVLSGRSPIEVLNPVGERTPDGEELVQTFYLETAGPNVIFAANRATHVYIPQSSLFELTDGTVRTGVELEKGAVYTVVSRRAPSTAAGLRLVGDARQKAPLEILRRYAAAPVISDRVKTLADDIARGTTNTYDTVRAIEAWMGANTQYSLDIPPLAPGTDSVDQFLFEDRIGFCEQIASSLVVMLRSQGIPARLAVGYTPGERNPFTGLYEVRAKDAHAWAEVFFPGYGWQSFDPTAQVPFAGEPQPDAARVGLKEYLAKHLPDLSPPVIAGLVVVFGGLLTFLMWTPLQRLRKRLRARRKRPWAAVQLDRLDAIGTKLGRSRDAHETTQEYTSALGRTVLRDPRLPSVADALAVDAFAEDGLDADARSDVERVIDDLAARS